jgi:hypothetical protein
MDPVVAAAPSLLSPEDQGAASYGLRLPGWINSMWGCEVMEVM